jgi:hypothetical protein
VRRRRREPVAVDPDNPPSQWAPWIVSAARAYGYTVADLDRLWRAGIYPSDDLLRAAHIKRGVSILNRRPDDV